MVDNGTADLGQLVIKHRLAKAPEGWTHSGTLSRLRTISVAGHDSAECAANNSCRKIPSYVPFTQGLLFWLYKLLNQNVLVSKLILALNSWPSITCDAKTKDPARSP